MRWTPRTLRARLLLAVLAVEVVVFGFALWSSVQRLDRTIVEVDQQRLAQSAALLSTAIASPLATRDMVTLERRLRHIVSTEGILSISVFDRSGREFLAVVAPGAEHELASGMAEQTSRPIRSGDRTVGAMKYVVSQSLIVHARQGAIVQGLLYAGVAIAASLVGLWLIGLLLTRNLSALSRTAGAVGAGDLAVRANVQGEDEVATAARQLNQMLDSLQEAGRLLHASEAQYRQLVDAAQQPIVVLEGNRPVFANHAAARLLGYDSPQPLLAVESFESLLAPAHRSICQTAHERLMSGRVDSERYELHVLPDDERPLWVDCMASRVHWQERPAIQLVMLDITQRKLAETALQERELQLASTIENAPLILFTVDHEGTITFVAGKALELVGLTQAEAIGRKYFDVAGVEADPVGGMRAALSGQGVSNVRLFRGRLFESTLRPLYDENGNLKEVIGIAFDVTEREQAQAALRSSEARFRDFAHASSDWLWETDAEHRITYVSEGHSRVRGEPVDYYIGKRRDELAADSGDRETWERYRRLVAARLPIRDFVFLRRSGVGQDDWLRINGAPIYDETGAFMGYRGTATDVTEQMRTAAALQASEARFRNLVEGSLQGLLIMDTAWKVLFANQAAADIYGYASPEELMALPSADVLVAPSDRERLREYHRARSTGEQRPSRYEHRGLRKDGRELWLQTFVRLVEWEGGTCVQSTLVDMTEQKAAEEEQRRSEAKFRVLVEHTDLATFIFGEDWRIQFINESAARLLGYASVDAARQAIRSGLDLVYAEDRERLEAYRADWRSGAPAPSRYEYRAVRRDGQLLWLQNIVSNVDWEGQPATLALALDITAHKLREEQLRQAQKMEAVGHLTGGVAHDFNNLLTVITGNLELIRLRSAGAPQVLQLVASAASASERGAMLVQRLLAFSRRQALKPEPVDVNRLVTGVTDLLGRTLGEQIDVETVLASGLWPALVDRNQLENTLLNLAINARDAMPTGGKLTIETGNIRIDEDYASLHEEVKAGQYVMMAVSDTGEGMTEEVLRRAFDPFFTTKEVGRGSGLGLSMIYGFVKQTGGHVKIYSEPGQGTTVKVYLPRATGAAGRHAASGSLVVAPRGTQQKILVVEDDAAVRDLAEAILSNLGYLPVMAEDGPTALRLLDAHPDVVLLFTDVVLAGGMSGVELVRAAHERRPDLKVLYMSGYTENAIIHHGRLDEGVELLEKPFRIDLLARKVRTVLEGD